LLAGPELVILVTMRKNSLAEAKASWSVAALARAA